MLATLYLIAIWLDIELPMYRPSATYGLLIGYIVFAAAIALITWSSWWYDARLAGPVHAIDILIFTLLVLLTDGHTSPYFAFFMFVMLSAAIRWGWRATALTAVLLALMFTISGLLDLTPGDPLEPDRFVIRAGHLAILSMILIWFGEPAMAALFLRRPGAGRPTGPRRISAGRRAKIRAGRPSFDAGNDPVVRPWSKPRIGDGNREFRRDRA